MAYSADTMKKWQSLLANGTITPETYNENMRKTPVQDRINPATHTSWGTRLPTGQTREQSDQASYDRNIASTTQQLQDLGYTTPTGGVTPGSTYDAPDGVMTPRQTTVTPMSNTGQISTAPVMVNQSGQVATPTNQVTNQPSSPTTNFGEGAYADWLAAQYQQGMGSLDYARSQSNLALDEAESKISPFYYDERNRAAAQGALARRAEQERMASQGLSGGVSTQGEISRNVALQGQLGSLGRSEAEAMADIARDRAGVDADYAFGQGDLASQLAVLQAEQGIQDEATATAEQKEQVANQYLSDMIASGNATDWLMVNGASIAAEHGGDVLDYLWNFASAYTPEPTSATGGQPDEVPFETSPSFDMVYNTAITNPEITTGVLELLRNPATAGSILPDEKYGEYDAAQTGTIEALSKYGMTPDELEQYMFYVQSLSEAQFETVKNDLVSGQQGYQQDVFEANRPSELATFYADINSSDTPVTKLNSIMNDGFLETEEYYTFAFNLLASSPDPVATAKSINSSGHLSTEQQTKLNAEARRIRDQEIQEDKLLEDTSDPYGIGG